MNAKLAEMARHLAAQAPTLSYNHTHVLTVGWQPPAAGEPVPASYLLQLSVERQGQSVVHATRHAASDVHSIAWTELPTESEACFRVAAISAAPPGSPPPPPLFSDSTCYSSCRCVGGSSLPNTAAGSSCASCAFAGAILGALLAVGGFFFVGQRPRGSDGKHSASLAHGLVGGVYSHVRTADEGGIELDDSRLPPTTGTGLARVPLETGGGGAHPALEPPPDLQPDQFELRWSSCATRSHVLEAVVPRLSPSAPDEIETALVERGFFCVAAGAVGTVDKLYFAAQLRGSTDWLMLELVLHRETASAQATFRCDAPHRLVPLADDIGTALGRAMTTRFNCQRY